LVARAVAVKRWVCRGKNGMSDQPEHKSGATSSGFLPRNTALAWGSVVAQFVLFLAGGISFTQAFYGNRHNGHVALLVAIGAWTFVVFSGVCVLQVVYGFGVAARSKSAIVTLAVLGIALNVLALILFALLYVGLQGIGR
jgi:hypothetical protein